MDLDILIPDGEYEAKFAFADGEYDPSAIEYIDITIGSGGSECGIVGDVNDDQLVNIQDIILLVQEILD